MSARGLVDYNADACEAAKGPRCRCGCKGKLHGVAHSEEWRGETAARIDAENEQRRQFAKSQTALFDDRETNGGNDHVLLR